MVRVEEKSQELLPTPVIPNILPPSLSERPTTSPANKIAQMKEAAAKQKRDMEEEEREKMQ